MGYNGKAMKIGIFDSGLGGLFITKSLVKDLPQYDYVYLGDTQRVPYGNRSSEAVYQFLKEAVNYLFEHDCELIIVACNTASACASLRKIQKEYLPRHYPKRRVLGIILPTAESAMADTRTKRIGVLATQGTVNSEAYIREVRKISPSAKVFQQAAPLLVPLIESNGIEFAKPILRSYLSPLKKRNIDTLILGCTHYPILKKQIGKICGKDVRVISQDEIISEKVKDYLKRHPEIDEKLEKKRRRQFLVTDLTPTIKLLSKKWFGSKIELKVISL
jgi:glutamate racemase